MSSQTRRGRAPLASRPVCEYQLRIPEAILEVHEALDRLEKLDSRKAQIVEMVFFGGLEQDLAAEALSVSPATLRRELRLAKAWIYNEMQRL